MSNLIVVAYEDVDRARVLPRISPFSGRVIRSSLSDEAAGRLRDALSTSSG
jgi:uncharacterized membrane protein